MLTFQFEDCEEIEHEGVVHAIPEKDSETHDIVNCRCNPEVLMLGDTVLAMMHQPFDRRDLIDSLFDVETMEEAHNVRLEYMKANKDLLRKGKMDKTSYWNKWRAFEGTFQDIFRTN